MQYVNIDDYLSPELHARVEKDVKTICTALGYDLNTVEFAIKDGIPYAIDFMNSAPDFDISSLGEEHFAWVVDRMADLCVELALRPPASGASAHRWDALLGAPGKPDR